MNETWRAIGFIDRFEVSNLGRIRHYVSGEWRICKPVVKKNTGYAVLTARIGKKRRQFLIHRLVLEAFKGSAPLGYQACHNNGVRDDNRLENLRWDTPAGNNADMKEHGTAQIGERNKRAKLTAEQVMYIRQSPENQPALARKFGVTQVLISRIRLRKAWAHV